MVLILLTVIVTIKFKNNIYFLYNFFIIIKNKNI